MNQQRQFECVWGDGYCQHGVEIHSFKHFDPDLGYDEYSVDRVDELEVGEIADLTDPSGVHYVTRIQ